VEANYLSGELPDELLHLDSLIYLYVRRNQLDVYLPEVLADDTLPSIFSLWLDSNNVVGPIPPSIASKSDLASLSIATANLAGPLPSELGLLEGLRRIWMYENQLTGSIPSQLSQLTRLEVLELHGNLLTGEMPSEVCNTIQTSAYTKRSLSADCNEIICPEGSCCTQCYS